ncbi:conserved exported hypothetical protein [Hyella patelloides LEGE 07179]|uniref:DUF928 domain-containing protein n=1 Tax=Hyella patelloides LEGE 07179 TaxID=945734 RepID=A0A563VRY2_9CYAN|nr:DUF928 domain-containing protein [Hyella patelloides]VEP14214.1 conserved exported hypothetical protein [Hyella patelloides LEGE 07179]
MNQLKYIWSKKSLLATSLISLYLVCMSPLAIQAQEATTKNANTYNITFDPPNENQPQATRGGASRGAQCAINSQEISESFAPLIPASNYGLTTTSHPTLLVHIPATSAESVFFTIQDENEEEVYQTILPIGTKSGIVSLDVPKEAPALETGKNYKWSLVLMCDNKLRPDSPVIQGHIKRVQPELQLATQLESATPLEMAALYGKAGIWYETVATLAQLRQAQPQNQELLNTWNSILNSVGLEQIAKAELME